MTAIDDMEKKDPDWLKNPMGPAFEKVGITPDYLADRIKEELEAMETKVFCTQGFVSYSDPLIAWHIRQRARQDAHKLMGDYPAEQVEHQGSITVEVVNYASDDTSKLPA